MEKSQINTVFFWKNVPKTKKLVKENNVAQKINNDEDTILIPTDEDISKKFRNGEIKMPTLQVSNFPNSRYSQDMKLANFRSYGQKTGNYYFNSPDLDILTTFILENKLAKYYSFIEIKTEYYKFIVDIDLKLEKYDELKTINNPVFIIDYVLSNFIKALNLLIQNPNCDYIYADKQKGYGLHLYFPNIIVNNDFSIAIHQLCKNLCIKENLPNLTENQWNKIIDFSVAKQCGLRLLYNIKKDVNDANDFYKVNIEKSTHKFKNPHDKKEHIDTCFYRTNCNAFNFIPAKENNIDLYKKYLDVKTQKNNISPKNKKVINLLDVNKLELKVDKTMIVELLDNLSIKRLSNYETWIQVIFFCRNFGLHKESINISKKADKFDNNTIDIIDKVFSNKIPDKHYTHNTLFEWCRVDNYQAYITILLKYNFEPKLSIFHTDDYLLHNFNNYNVIQYNENCKYISDDFIKITKHHIDNYDENTLRTFILHCFPGCGKSTATGKIIDYYKSTCVDWNSQTILALTSRKTMIPTIQNIFYNEAENKNICKLVSYLDKDFDDNKPDIQANGKHPIYPNKLIISMEKLCFVNPKRHDYKIIILDEINSLIMHFYSPTMRGRRRECFTNMIHYIKHAELVICCDANITNITLEFLKSIRSDILYYRNTFPNKKDIPLRIFTNEDTFDETIKDKTITKKFSDEKKIQTFCSSLIVPYIKDSKSVFIFTDSKSYAILIKDFLMKYNDNPNYFLLFTDDSGSLEEIKNCNKTFLNKCVIVSRQ